MKSLRTISFFFLFITNIAFTQFKYFKVESGQEINLTDAEHFTIELNKELRSGGANFFIEVDLVKVREMYNYDQLQFGINSLPDESGKSYHIANPRTITFDDENAVKQRGDAGKVRVWLFETDNFTSNSTNVVTVTDPLSISDAELTYQIVITGAYFSKIDRRWQNDELVLFRVYDRHETIVKPDFKLSFTYPESLLLERKYKRMMSSHPDSLDGLYNLGYIKSALEKEINKFDQMETGVVYGTIKTYPNIIEALTEISAYRDKEIRAEKDMKRALEMLEHYNSEFPKFLVSELQKEDLKSINKALKSAENIEEKIAVFMR